MKSTVTMFCILALAVGLVLPVYAEVQNVKVSGDITERGFYRSEYTTLDDDAGTDSSDAFYTSTVRLRVDADLTDNVSTTVRLLNERNWDSVGIAGTENIDIDLAYVTFREFLYAPLTATAGRQLLRYGSGLVVGDPDTNAATISPPMPFFFASFTSFCVTLFSFNHSFPKLLFPNHHIAIPTEITVETKTAHKLTS